MHFDLTDWNTNDSHIQKHFLEAMASTRTHHNDDRDLCIVLKTL